MSLDWIAREQSQPGLILAELKNVNQEIEEARQRGLEMRFLKERRDILLLASYQFDMEINSMC
jgi:LIX1-like protein